ncbi:hypothetical protein PV05_08676 [Exophiala xenobiotica]|uniref:Class II aldolase/adducin N-terminal domain-containing protein n=1 Tax=Exophiala xenobiotica TaxID=348802 RepID=A0A0D2ECK7_9EURO|nr:uncharacterized protein PV05_08676 [Exophiala xenobiotica]KIW53078.1 hypothetical protein PV05_08676 [Exophiala xenobiotica]
MAPALDVYDDTCSENYHNQALGKTKSGRTLKIRTYPKFESLEEERLYRKQHLAAAFRIFADRGFDEGVAGHISLWDPILTDHFWLNPLSMHFSQICVTDLILVNEEGEVVIGDEPINAAAFAIHSEIHKARRDVHTACHAHSVYGKAFAAFGRELDMITQDSLRFYKSHAVYDNFGGVVLDREEGKRIANALGNGKAVILQNDWAQQGSGHKKNIINDEEAEFTYKSIATDDKGWLSFQGYHDEQLAKTGGSFLK